MKIIICKCEWKNCDVYNLITNNGEGTVTLSIDRRYKSPLIENLFVNKDKRHQGIATMLLNKIDEILKNENLLKARIDADTPWIGEWYERRGYDVHKWYEKHYNVHCN